MGSHDAPLFTGCATALVTPFLPGGVLDEAGLRRLIARQIDAHTDALVLLGTTGEPCTLTMQERERILVIAMQEAGGKLPVLVGTGSNDTRQAIAYARQAHRLGAQGQLCVTPYYNKTTQAGLLRHYEAILDSCELPMIVYHVPGRTGMSVTTDTLAKLAVHPRIVGIKEASGSLSLASELLSSVRLPLYSGNDDMTLALMAMGACGVISVCSNVAPQPMHKLVHACLDGDFVRAAAQHRALLPLMHALFSQVNPIPVKAALSMMGEIYDVLRLPLVPMEEPHRGHLARILHGMELLPDDAASSQPPMPFTAQCGLSSKIFPSN